MYFGHFERAWPPIALLTCENFRAETVFREACANGEDHIDKPQFVDSVARIWPSAPLAPERAAERLQSWAWSLGEARCYPDFPDQEQLDSVCEILDGELWLTNWRGACNEERVLPLGISRVVSMGSEFEADEPLAPHGVRYKQVSLKDEVGQAGLMRNAVVGVVDWIEEAVGAGQRVLVHCAAGMSRSATIVLSFMMLKRGFWLLDAFEHLRSRRRVVWPNVGFMAFLVELEAQLPGYRGPSITVEEYEGWVAFSDRKSQQLMSDLSSGDTESDEDEASGAPREPPEPFNPGPSEVIPGLLFLGSGVDANAVATLGWNNITSIINCAEEVAVSGEAQSQRQVWNLELVDGVRTDISALFPRVFATVEEQREKKGRVLINCREGRNRSASFVVAFLMHSKGLDLAAALASVRQLRPLALGRKPVEPNCGFLKQLRDFEFQLFGNREPSYKATEEDFSLLCDLDLVSAEDRAFYCG